MKHLSLILILIILTSVSAFSQDDAPEMPVSFGLGANLTFPLAELKDQVATGYGLTAFLKLSVLPIVDLTGGVEYLYFTGKEVTLNNLTTDATGTALGFIVGGRLNLLPIVYVGLETGAYGFTKKLPGGDVEITRGFLAPMGGLKLGPFDLGLRYVSAGDDTFWGLRGMIWF